MVYSIDEVWWSIKEVWWSIKEVRWSLTLDRPSRVRISVRASEQCSSLRGGRPHC